MSKEGSPDYSAVSSSVPVAELKALLKDSLVKILRKNPSLLRPSEDAGSGSLGATCPRAAALANCKLSPYTA